MAEQRTDLVYEEDLVYEAMTRQSFMTYATQEKGYQLYDAGVLWSMLVESDQFRKSKNEDGELIVIIPTGTVDGIAVRWDGTRFRSPLR